MDRSPEPRNADERGLLLGWLAFHRDALAAKCEGLMPEQLVATPVPPSDLSLLGLVRHMTEMERVYLSYALGGSQQLAMVYCTDDNPEGDIVGLSPDMAQGSVERWHAEQAAADLLISAAHSLDDISQSNKRAVRWNLVKVIGEYARHNGHADLIRESIDGATGE
jgi:Protein of unknown function (DUF664)